MGKRRNDTVARAAAIFIVLPLVFSVSCQKACQPSTGTAATSLTAAQWRLTGSNDPQFSGVNKYTFLIFQFARDFTGTIESIQNNATDGSQPESFSYNVQSTGSSGTLRISYGSELQSATTIDYQYQLGQNLTLTTRQGLYYKFVPYSGVVEPDSTCTY